VCTAFALNCSISLQCIK